MNYIIKTINFILLINFLIIVSSCSSNKQVPQNQSKENAILHLEYENEGFIDNNTFRVIVIIPAEEQYDEISIKQKAQERAYVSLKNYIISKNKVIDSKIQNYLTTTINTYGFLQKRSSTSSTRDCYFFDIIKSGLKAEIESLGK